MCQLFETIKVKNNELLNLEFHQERINRSCFELWKKESPWSLNRIISLPLLDQTKTYRCKFVYTDKDWTVEFFPYQIRPIRFFHLVNADHIHYSCKYLDRTIFDQLKLGIPDSDEIIIVKNNELTDCSYANLVFYDGVRWVTPENPLLKGTKRAQYLKKKIISEEIIRVDDLLRYTKVRLMNAMIDLEESPELDTKDIIR